MNRTIIVHINIPNMIFDTPFLELFGKVEIARHDIV